MFPLPSGRNKNKKHLSILAHSPNPVLHTTTSELSPLFSPADFLELLRRDHGSLSSGPSFPAAGTRLSPFSAAFPATGTPFGYYGSSPAEDEPFRFSLEVDASGHASTLPLQLAAPSPVAASPVAGGSAVEAVDDSQPRGPSLLSPFHFGPYPLATSPTSPLHTAFSPPSSSDSSHSSVGRVARYDAGLSLTVFPASALGHGLGFESQALETQAATISPTTVPGMASMRPPRPVLVSRNFAPAVAPPQQQEKESASPTVRKALLKQKRSMSNLRERPALSTASSPRGLGSANPSPTEATAAATASLASLLPIMPREDLLSASKKSHNSNRSANYTPRPPNSWILYRSETNKQMKLAKERGEVFPIPDAVKSHPDVASGDGVMAQANVSKMVALMWKLESKDVKLKYDQLSAIRKLEHAEMYPGYKYQPARKAATPAVVKSKVPARRPAPPLVMYPSTTPRSQDLSPPPSATASSASASAAGRASHESSAGKHRTLKKKKKSRSTLSSRATSPAQALPLSYPASAPIEWSYSHPMPSAPAWPHGPPQPWVIPPPADAAYYTHPHPPLPTPPDHPYQSFEVPGQVWVGSPQQQPYYPIYLNTPPDTAVGTPHGMYTPSAPFVAFAPQAGPSDYHSPAHSETPSSLSSYLHENYVHPDFGVQMSPPPAPHASFDGVAYTQVISEAYDGDLAYHAIDVDGRLAEAFVAPAAESSLAATWSLLEDGEEDEPHEASTDTDGWSTQGDWTIDSHDHVHRWSAHRR